MRAAADERWSSSGDPPAPPMTEESARKVANVILGAAAVGAVYVVATTPPLRRLVWRLARTALTGTLPAWIGKEVHDAWIESGRRNGTL
jgi:hypothetical protein